MTNRQPPAKSFEEGMKLFDESQKAYAAWEAVRRDKCSYLVALYERLKQNKQIDHVMETLAGCERDEEAALLKWQGLNHEVQEAFSPAGAEVPA